MRKTILATLIIFAATLLITATLAAVRSTKRPDKNIHAINASTASPISDNQAIETAPDFEIRQEDTAALTAATEEFRPRKILTASTPNFSTPLRRAPLRRKGRVQG